MPLLTRLDYSLKSETDLESEESKEEIVGDSFLHELRTILEQDLEGEVNSF
jgi:hypothetical protein